MDDVPGTAEVVLTVDDREVVITESVELDRSSHPPESGPDDDRIELLGTHGVILLMGLLTGLFA
jgi:hypothetical protein